MSAPELVNCRHVTRMRATAAAQKRCPFVGEDDHGEVTVEWTTQGTTVELHSLARWIDGFKSWVGSHEEFTRFVGNVLRDMGLHDVTVKSRWRTASMSVEVEG